MGFDIDQNDDVTMSAADLASLVGERDALIAASKQMLDAIDSYGVGFSSGSTEFWQGVDAARAALAKAGSL